MVSIKKTNNDGTMQEIEFSNAVDAAKALGVLFGVELPANVQRQSDIADLNAALRQSWHGHSTTNPSELFEQARQEGVEI